MFWYLLMCFTGSSGIHCMKVEIPSAVVCNMYLSQIQRYAELRNLPIEASCISLKEYV